jgi:hypothetical protein
MSDERRTDTGAVAAPRHLTLTSGREWDHGDRGPVLVVICDGNADVAARTLGGSPQAG